VTADSLTFDRLVGALEDLVSQERALLAGEDLAGLRHTQSRAEPIVQELVRLGEKAVTPATRARLEALLIQRQQSQETLRARVASLSEALRQNEANQRRAARIAPAYASHGGGDAARRLSVRG